MKPLLVFAHGAGAPSSHPWMIRWADRLQACGRVHSFDYDYMAAGRKRPDRLPQLLATHAAAVQHACAEAPQAPIVLVGKSMGSRIGCHLSVDPNFRAGAAIAALVCFGYPLRSASSGASRADILKQLRTPILFVQGTRDALCPLHELQSLLPQLQARSSLHIVEGGDHSLMVGKRALRQQGCTQDEIDTTIMQAVQHFVNASLADMTPVAPCAEDPG